MYYSVFNLFGAGIWILFVLLYALICAGFSCWLASIKGYGTVAWFGLGFLFGVFALFAIGVAPLRQEERRENDQKNETEPKTIPSKEIKTETLGTGAVLIVSAGNTSLQEGSGVSTKFIKNLMIGTKVKFIKTGESTKEDGITAPWLFVETEDGDQGYCFSRNLKEYKG